MLGYYTDAQPMSYRDPSGNAAGYAVTLCQQVADEVKAELGAPQLAVEWVALTRAAGMQTVQQGKVDLLCGADAASLTNRANVSFSLPIFPGGISALLRADASKALQNVLEAAPAALQADLARLPVFADPAPNPVGRRRHVGRRLGEGPRQQAQPHRKARYGRQLRHGRGESGQARIPTCSSATVPFCSDWQRAVLTHSKLRVLTRHYTYEPLALALARNNDDFRLVVDRALLRFYASPKFGDAYTAVFGQPDADTVEYFRGLPR